MPAVFDPYGMEYGDWEDPHTHIILGGCTGCAMCVGWKDRTVEEIERERTALVLRRRARDRPEPTCKELAKEDKEYWNETYSGA